MKPLPVYIIKRSQVEAITSRPPIPHGDLANYLSVRPKILDDGFCDIFQPNCRSEHQSHTAFELFSIQDHVDSGTVVVFPFWLELFHAYGDKSHVGKCIDWLACTYPGNPIIIQWNHDLDQAKVLELQDLPENMFVLTYNTSKPNPTDIVLPFWAIETHGEWDAKANRVYRGGFIGYVGNLDVRRRMREAFRHNGGSWLIVDTTEIKHSLSAYLEYMWQFDFALCPRGGGLSSYRFFEAIQCGCVPVLFADHVALPYRDFPWGEIICRIPEADAGNFDLVWDLLGGIDVRQRRQRIAEVREQFSLAGVQREIHKRITEYLEG